VAAGALIVAVLQGVFQFPHKRPAATVLTRNIVDGPWGRLELTSFLLEKPPELLPNANATLEPTEWHFAGHDRATLTALLQSCAVTPAQIAELTSTSVLSEGRDGCLLRPLPETVLELSPASRERLYAELEKGDQNVAQRHPFRIRPPEEKAWFARVGLPPEKVTLLRRLIYRRGEALCFADLTVARACLAPSEFAALVRALYSSDTLLIKLRVQTNDPIDRIAAYWGKGGREQSLKTLLQSAARTPGGFEIDAERLLPPLPRTWLYTYPAGAHDAPSVGDCYWTSLNFFREVAEERFLDPASRTREIREHYGLVSQADRLGDVIVFADAQGITQHACVYVAADIVFTKNGAQNGHPWVLMRMDQMRALYGAPGGTVLVFRPLT
jgi:hypothetical protein